MIYIFWPLFAVFIVIFRLVQGFVHALWVIIWYFRIPTVREVYTVDGEYLFEDCDWKQFFKDMLIYRPINEEEE